MQLKDSIMNIKGVGPKTAAQFNKLKVYTIEDLLHFYPRNYLCYDEPTYIEDAVIGSRVAIKAQIQSYVDVKRIRSLTIVSCTVKDVTGTVKLTWFNSPFLKQMFHIGQSYVFVGILQCRNNQLVIEHPEYYEVSKYESIVGKMRPLYPLTEGLSNKTVTKAIENVLPLLEQLEDVVPQNISVTYELPPISTAIKNIHFPENMDVLMTGRNRLVFDEFFTFLANMHEMREHTVKANNLYKMKETSIAQDFIHELPFSLTKGQMDAVQEIINDLSGDTLMNRLVQGDVGSGKTVVAEIAMLLAVQNGFQAAFMAPTEVLAMQHYEGVKKDFEQYHIRVALLVGSTKPSEKRRIYDALEKGEIDIVIGTHALIQDKVQYHKLALVITDEQHRFGVRQRAKLSEKGEQPHVLVMSATPIPRTLAIIMYGDLDISVIKDMPSNRKAIKNCVVSTKYRPTAYKFINAQIEEGHQIYIICPMVEESENVEVENVIGYQERLKDIFPSNVNIAYLHGKMSAEEKNQIMDQFAHRNIDILVSTTVIEVGINNPNATVMMIENAEKFGLAQLHQLRGRVGRGDAQSYCIMVCESERQEAMDRLNILNTSNDGFYIANEDLKLRGPGDFFGVRQSGEMLFRLGDIYANADILKKANDAIALLEKDNFDFTLLTKRSEMIQL